MNFNLKVTPSKIDGTLPQTQRASALLSPRTQTPDLEPQQNSILSFPDSLQIKSEGKGQRIIVRHDLPSRPSSYDLAAAERLARTPHTVLKDILYVQWRCEGTERGFFVGAFARHFWYALGSLSDLTDLLLNRAIDPTHLSTLLGVAPLRYFNECINSHCGLNRLEKPQIRAVADNFIVGQLIEARPNLDPLDITFIGSGNFFAEISLLQKARNKGFKDLSVHFIDDRMAPLFSLGRGHSIDDHIKRGYSQNYQDRAVKRMSAVNSWLGKNFVSSQVSFYASHADYIQCQRHKEKFRANDAVVSLDPGMEVFEVASAFDAIYENWSTLGRDQSLAVSLCSTVDGLASFVPRYVINRSTLGLLITQRRNAQLKIPSQTLSVAGNPDETGLNPSVFRDQRHVHIFKNSWILQMPSYRSQDISLYLEAMEDTAQTVTTALGLFSKQSRSSVNLRG